MNLAPVQTLFSTRSWAPNIKETCVSSFGRYKRNWLTIAGVDTITVGLVVVVENVSVSETEGGRARIQVLEVVEGVAESMKVNLPARIRKHIIKKPT